MPENDSVQPPPPRPMVCCGVSRSGIRMTSYGGKSRLPAHFAHPAAVSARPAATTTAGAPAPDRWSAGPDGYGGVICPAAWRAAQLGRTSTCLDLQAEQRNLPHTSGNGVLVGYRGSRAATGMVAL